jgi:diguanylate cyclase (GGDEF)-like protein
MECQCVGVYCAYLDGNVNRLQSAHMVLGRGTMFNAMHSLRYKVPVAVFAVFLMVLIVFMGVLHRIVLDSYLRIEQTEISRDVARARTALMSSVDPLESTVLDWAVWTDTYQYLAGENPGFEQANLVEESLANLDLDFMALYADDGRVVWAGSFDPESLKFDDSSGRMPVFNQATVQVRPSDEREVRSGLALIDGRPALFASSEIVKNQWASLPNGFLVAGTFVDSSDEERVESITGLSVTLDPAVGSAQAAGNGDDGGLVSIDVSDRKTIVGSQVIFGVGGDPVLSLAVSGPRSATARAYETLGLVAWAMTAAVLLFGGVLAITLDRTILRRLAHLHRFVGRENPRESAHSYVGGSDEIADLAVALDHAVKRAVDTEKQLKHQADHDYLTGLPNRRRLTAEITKSIGEARRTGKNVALLVMDLDWFKEINDVHGHIGGDEALRCFAQRALAAVRDYSTVSRIGGDEFAVLLPNTDLVSAEQVCERLHEILREIPCTCAGNTFHLAASVGIAVFPEDGDSAESLISSADAHMYEVKRARHGSRDQAVRPA